MSQIAHCIHQIHCTGHERLPACCGISRGDLYPDSFDALPRLVNPEIDYSGVPARRTAILIVFTNVKHASDENYRRMFQNPRRVRSLGTGAGSHRRRAQSTNDHHAAKPLPGYVCPVCSIAISGPIRPDAIRHVDRMRKTNISSSSMHAVHRTARYVKVYTKEAQLRLQRGLIRWCCCGQSVSSQLQPPTVFWDQEEEMALDAARYRKRSRSGHPSRRSPRSGTPRSATPSDHGSV